MGTGVGQTRAEIAQARRVVVKVGSSSLTTPQGGLDHERIRDLTDVLAERRKAGTEVVLVSSGAVAAGMAPLGLTQRPRDLATQQAAASVGQGLLLARYTAEFARHSLTAAQILLTADDLMRRAQYRNAQRAMSRLLEIGAVPIVNENDSVATSELKVGDNDTLSAWVAYLVGADLLVILTDVPALFDADPRRVPEARPVRVVADVSEVAAAAGGAGSEMGTGGMSTKLAAARIAADAGIETVVVGGGGAGLEALARGEEVGTRFLASRGVPARKAWILNQPVAGVVEVDAGARDALRSGRSLLPRGVVGVRGDFAFGDAVAVECQGERFAVGLTNYAAADLRRIAGRHTSELADLLGDHQYDEAVHRDNLVLGRPVAGGSIVTP